MGAKLDITGQKFNRLTALHIAGRTVHGKVEWACKCDCGNEIKVIGSQLKNGNTKSCGCYQKEQTGNASRRHGHTHTPTYNIWKGMRQRCNNPSNRDYENYGGRGITISSSWNGYSQFLKDMGEKPDKLSIERINNNGNYEPSNCKWATHKEQSNNRSSNVLINYNGANKTLTQWAEKFKLNPKVIRNRVQNLDWSIEKALTTPIEHNSNITIDPLTNYKVRLLTVDGQTHSITEWSKLTGIKASTITERLRRGWSEVRAIKQTSVVNGREILHNGTRYTIKQLADKYNMKASTLAERIRSNWSLTRALNESVTHARRPVA